MAKEACLVSSGAIKNTGSECDTSLGPIKMLIMANTSLKFTDEDLEDFTAYVDEHTHAPGTQRMYPLFGNRAEIDETTTNDESPVTYTSPDTGKITYIRTGAKNLTFATTAGGLCLAEALNSMGKANLGFIPVDKDGAFIVKKNTDGTYSPFKATSSPQSPIFAVAATPYQNRFALSFNPDTFVQLGKIYADEPGLLDLEGLFDVNVDSRAAATTTTVTVGGLTDCKKSDIYDSFGDALAVVGAWSLKKADGTPVTITGVAKDTVNKGYVLTFASQTSGTVLKADLSAAAALYALNVEGIESTGPVAITIP